MQELDGKVAVVTGGASGIGLAMGQRFAGEGMKVVLADVETSALEAAVEQLSSGPSRPLSVEGVVTDVSSYDSVVALRDQVLDRHGAVHVLCNNAGVGSGAEGRMWEHELNDWRWAMGVNLWGVIHGVNAFVPLMLEQGDDGHVVNTSSGNGGISPLPGTPIYALTKSAVVVLTECLYAQLRDVGANVSASVLFPGPNMLRTGLWTSWRNRPETLAKERPRQTPYPTLDDIEAQMRKAGIDLEYTPVEEVADRVVDAIRAGTFWILAPSERTDDSIKARAQSMLERSNPTYLKDLVG
jgi:NAD(P)-dependent dehydrogenase (short-subunit alcohol dehydrogenase family)